MSVQNCGHCKTPYWRFRGDHPPKGFCSTPCHDLKKAGKKEERPQLPENALRAMMAHRAEKHGSSDVLGWYDCSECENLEKAYSESLEWHYDRITREIVGQARA